MPSLSLFQDNASLKTICSENPSLNVCSRYPIKRLILDDKGEVIQINLYKAPTNGDPPSN